MSMSASKYLIPLLFVAAFGCADEPAPEATASSTNNDGKGDFFGFDDVQFADLYNGTASVDILPVRGRLVEDDKDDIGDLEVTPFSQLSQDETKNADIEVYLVVDGERMKVADLQTDKEGYFDAVVDISALGLSAGRYEYQVWYEDEAAGSAKVVLLENDRNVPVVRSDVDLTYINTDFQTATAMFDLVITSAATREALPAMPLVYTNLRGQDSIPVTFLSGSPKFFKRTIESKMVLDGMEQDGLVLKPFKDIVSTNVRDLSLSAIVPGLKEQIGYKLTWLLKLRLQLPANTPEILMGDDSEADVVAYNLYYRLLSGELNESSLHDELVDIQVAPAWITQVDAFARLVEVGPDAVPVAIYINKTTVTNAELPVSQWTIPGVTRYHEGAWPLMLDLEEEGLVSGEAVSDVHDALIESGASEEALDAHAAAADFLGAAL